MNYGDTIKPFDTLREIAEKTVPLLHMGRVAISGGSTYGALFEHWVEAGKGTIKAQFFPVDERVVPFEDDASNWRVATEKLFQPLGDEISPGNFGADFVTYEECLIREFQGETPEFDVLFLGVGDDGHTASLFPGGEYLTDRTVHLMETTSPKAPVNRVSLSPKSILNAKEIVVVIDGAKKKPIVDRILEGDESLPIVQLLKEATNLTIYINQNLLEERA